MAKKSGKLHLLPMIKHPICAFSAIICLFAAGISPVFAKDHLGIYSDWAAFRDANVPRCYAIAKPASSRLQRDYEPYATIATWPRRNLRGQVHFRLSRKLNTSRPITLKVGSKSFTLAAGGSDAWAKDKSGDAAIVAAMRSASTMVIRATDSKGRRFSNTYDLAGAATAMDAATLGCADL